MRFAFRRSIPVVVFALLVFGWAVDGDAKKARPLDKSEMADVWIGMGEGALDYFRCELTADGRGHFVTVFLHKPGHVFEIANWEFRDPDIRIVLQADPQNPTDIKSIVGKRRAFQMTLDLRGDDWRMKATLWRERDFVERRKLAEQALQERQSDESQ